MSPEPNRSEEIQPIIEKPLDFLQAVKQRVSQERDKVGSQESLYGLAFNAIESYYKLQEDIDTQHSSLRDAKPAGSRLVKELYTPAPEDRQLGLDVNGEFEIMVRQNGEIRIQRSPYAQEDYLIKTEHGQIESVSINPSAEETTPSLDTSLQRRIRTMLQFVTGYYRSYKDLIPQAEKFVKDARNMGVTLPSNNPILPKFPQQEIQHLRTTK